MARQCLLTGLSRSGLYYEPQAESALNLMLMRLLDEQYTRTPFFGVLKMTDALTKQGYPVNPKRVRRLLRQMGLEAIYPKPNLSKPAPGHRIIPTGCATSSSRGQTRCGRATSRISDCAEVSFIW